MWGEPKILDKKLVWNGGSISMFRHPFELKLEIVKFVLEGKHSYSQASQHYKIHQEQIRVWCNLYRNCGEDGLKPQKIRKYDGNFKVDVVEYMYANHLSLEKTRMHFKLPSSTIIALWKQMYNEKGREYLLNNRSIAIDGMQVKRNKRMRKSSTPNTSDLTDKSKEELLKEIEDLRMENDYLKKLDALVQKRINQQKKKKH